MSVDAARFSGLIPALQAGTYDDVDAPVTINKERATGLLFTEGFMDTNFAFVVPAGSPEYTSPLDFRGKAIAANRGSVCDSYLTEGK